MSNQDTMNDLVAYLRNVKSNDIKPIKPVFWLGAGCSVYDGVPLNNDLIRQVVSSDSDLWGSLQYRFDTFCEQLGNGAGRAHILRPFFQKVIRPDSPYHGLAQILEEGYVDIIFTFNIDNLLEQALNSIGMLLGRDYVVLKVPELNPQAVKIQLDAIYGPRIKLVKLHGDYEIGLNYMQSAEIVEYEGQIRELVTEYSKRVAVICGYSFFHLNVLNAFSQNGRSMYYVNKDFPDAPLILSIMGMRSKKPYFIDAPLGYFERFMPELCSKLGIGVP